MSKIAKQGFDFDFLLNSEDLDLGNLVRIDERDDRVLWFFFEKLFVSTKQKKLFSFRLIQDKSSTQIKQSILNNFNNIKKLTNIKKNTNIIFSDLN